MRSQLKFTSVILIALSSCIGYHNLADDRIRVPNGRRAFHDKLKNESVSKNVLDTTVFYEEIDSFERSPLRLRTEPYRMWRFYGNSDVNLFYIKGEVSLKDVDPSYTGCRGISFLKNDAIRIKYFDATGAGIVGPLEAEILVIGDTLNFVYDANATNRKFIKRKMPIEFFQFRADW